MPHDITALIDELQRYSDQAKAAADNSIRLHDGYDECVASLRAEQNAYAHAYRLASTAIAAALEQGEAFKADVSALLRGPRQVSTGEYLTPIKPSCDHACRDCTECPDCWHPDASWRCSYHRVLAHLSKPEGQ